MIEFLSNTHFISYDMEIVPHKPITQNIKNVKHCVLKGLSLPSVWQAIPVPCRTELPN